MSTTPPDAVEVPTPTYHLLRAGWTGRQLSRAVVRGELIRIRQGWYCAPSLVDEAQQAARVGGQLTCHSAARMLGLAVRGSSTLHVTVPRNAARLRASRDPQILLELSQRASVIVHWSGRPGAMTWPPTTPTPIEILMEMATCESPEFTIAAVDSAIRLGVIPLRSWLEFLPSLPKKLAVLLAGVDGRSGSITESLSRTRLCALGIVPQLQFKIAGVGFVDMLIGDRLVVEIDGRQYHTDKGQFEADRQRDARLSMLGYRVLRFSYRQVMDNWAQVRGSIEAAIARGDHLA
ncbi:MAG: DUF559 domain-containing protein [Salinibacterium sp.]|nr:DUF559 domain-containing protein [Salinibacterium sp.]